MTVFASGHYLSACRCFIRFGCPYAMQCIGSTLLIAFIAHANASVVRLVRGAGVPPSQRQIALAVNDRGDHFVACHC